MNINVDVGLNVSFNSISGNSGNLFPFLYADLLNTSFCFGADINPSSGISADGSTASLPGGVSNGTARSPTPLPFSPPGNTTVPGSNSLLPDGSALDCSAVAPSPGGQPCGDEGDMTCHNFYRWQCSGVEEGIVPPGTICACGAFRHFGWMPPNAVAPACASRIYCYSDTTFGVCGPSGIEAPQGVAEGTRCVGGRIVAA